VLIACVPAVNRTGRGADHPPHLAATYNNKQVYTSTLPQGLHGFFQCEFYLCLLRNIVVRSRNIFTSSANITTYYHSFQESAFKLPSKMEPTYYGLQVHYKLFFPWYKQIAIYRTLFNKRLRYQISPTFVQQQLRSYTRQKGLRKVIEFRNKHNQLDTHFTFPLYSGSQFRHVSGITCPSSGCTTQTQNWWLLCAAIDNMPMSWRYMLCRSVYNQYVRSQYIGLLWVNQKMQYVRLRFVRTGCRCGLVQDVGSNRNFSSLWKRARRRLLNLWLRRTTKNYV
jgi:hypothetical protein